MQQAQASAYRDMVVCEKEDTMRAVAIVSPVRTAVGNFGGGLKDVSAAELGATVIKAVLERTGLEPDKIDEVILGHGYPSGEEPAIGRLCALKAGLPIEVPGYQLDRRCSSGLQSILNACMMIQTGNADVVLAGGVESMSRVEFYTTEMRSGSRFGSVTLHDRLMRARATASPDERFGVISGMIETAENLSERHHIAREEQDAYALRSHQCAVAAIESGKFAEEIVPVSIPQRRGDPKVFQVDEGPRKDTSLEVLAKLRPVTPGGTVTAGNASSQNDAAAAQVLAVLKEWKLDNWDKLNVNGSGISLGHPIAATGARILTTLLHEMQRRDARYGLETMCVGGGQGVAAIFERR